MVESPGNGKFPFLMSPRPLRKHWKQSLTWLTEAKQAGEKEGTQGLQRTGVEADVTAICCAELASEFKIGIVQRALGYLEVLMRPLC